MRVKGRKPVTVKQIAQALEAAGGFVTQAAINLDVTPRLIFGRIAESQQLKDIIRDIRERYTDLAESEHIKQLKAGNQDAVKFHLRCQGKNRGYVEQRIEHTGSGGGPIDSKIIFEFVRSKGEG